MLRFCLLLALCLVVRGRDYDRVESVETFTHNVEAHLKYFTSPRNPTALYKSSWESARNYIKKQLSGSFCQKFNTTVYSGNRYEPDQNAEGCNIVKVVKGESDLNPLIVAAHYDTDIGRDNNRPLRQNGAGVATLLEVYKAYQTAVDWYAQTPKYDVIFVALDLNTLEMSTASASKSGAQFFVEEYIQKSLKDVPIRGAYILDSIATLNNSDNSQTLPHDFDKVFPGASEEIRRENEGKGNFLAAVTKSNSENLVDNLKSNYDDKGEDFRLQPLVSSDFGNGRTYQMFEEFGTHPFWMAGLPAVLLTDTTEDYRDISKDDYCTSCDFGNEDRMEFMHSTFSALVKTLIKQQTQDDSGSTGVQLQHGSWVAALGAVAVARLLAAM